MTKGTKGLLAGGAVFIGLAAFVGCKTCPSTSEPPSITADPVSTNVPPGGVASLQVAATGKPPLNYQWRHNGVPMERQNQRQLVIPDFQRAKGGSYDVIISNRGGTILSHAAIVRDTSPVTAASDKYEEARPLSGAAGAIYSDNIGATRQPGEPYHADEDGGSSVWFTWKSPANALTTFDTTGSSFDTVLAVYTAKSSEKFALTEIRSDDDSRSFYASAVTFNAVAGQEYRIAVDGVEGVTGSFGLRWVSDDRTTRGPPNIIKRPPTKWIVPIYGSVTLEVVAENLMRQSYQEARAPGLRYQWYFNDDPIKNATASSYSIKNVQDNDAGVYRVTVSNATDSVTLQTILYVERTYLMLMANVSGGTLTVPMGAFTKPPQQGNCPVIYSTNFSVLPTNCFPLVDSTKLMGATTNALNAGLDTQLRVFQRNPLWEVGCGVATPIGTNVFSFWSGNLPQPGTSASPMPYRLPGRTGSYYKFEVGFKKKPANNRNVLVNFEFSN